MKNLAIVIGIVMCTASLFAQTPAKSTAAPATDAAVTGDVKAEEPKAEEPKADDKKKKASLPDGYGDLAWGSDYTKVKEGVKGKIVFADENKIIVTRENEIMYRYGFFYIDPTRTGDIPEDMIEEYEHDPKQAKLFYTMVEFPYLSLKDVRKKMTEKYGEPTGDNIYKNRGALVWESESSIIIVWVDEYEKKPYSRRITYYSKKIAKDLKDYLYKIFNSKEIDVIKKMVP